MYSTPFFYLVSNLYKNAFFLYKFLYFFFKDFKEKDEKVLYRKFIKEGSVVLDIGGNIGYHTSFFSLIVGTTGKVFSFEPEKINFSHLAEQTKNKKNIKIYPYAVGENNRKIPFYVSKVINVQHQVYPSEKTEKKYLVKQVSIDRIFSKQKIDFIKIDIQGFEYEALKGMKMIIQKNPSLIISMEMEPRLLDQRDLSPNTVYKYILSQKLKVYICKNKKIFKIRLKDLDRYKDYKLYDADMWLLTKRMLQGVTFE